MSSILTSFSEKLTIAPVRNTDLANIIFESKDPQLAADVANRLAQTYIESTLEQRLASTQQASTYMSGRLSELKESLDVSEQRLQNFLESERLVDIEVSLP